jgi:hypothetical protein
VTIECPIHDAQIRATHKDGVLTVGASEDRRSAPSSDRDRHGLSSGRFHSPPAERGLDSPLVRALLTCVLAIAGVGVPADGAMSLPSMNPSRMPDVSSGHRLSRSVTSG